MQSLTNLVIALLTATTFLQFGGVSSTPVLKGMLTASGRLVPDFWMLEVSQV